MENELIEVDLPYYDLNWESVSDKETAFDAQDVLRCTYCEIEIATHFCRTCTDELCLSCRKFHLKSKVPSGHEIVTIKEKHEDGTTIEKCLIHENNIYFACCVECKLPVCTECMKTKHNGHPIVDISQMWNEEKEKVEQSISKLKERIPTDQFALSSAREGMFQIEKWFEKRREKYKKEGEILKEKVDELVMKNIERSKEDEIQQKRIFEEIEEENEIALRDSISKYEDQISNGHPAELLVFLKGHVLNPRKTDIFPRIQALNVKDVCTLNLQHQPESACCAESIIKIKTSPLNETEWIKIGYLDDNEEKYHGKGNILVVASIVIGTSHSCAAMSFLHDFKRNPLKISYVFSIANTVLHIKNGDITYAEEEEEIEHIENDRKEVLNCSFLKMKITASLLKHSTMEVKDGSTIHFSTFYTKIVKFWRNRVLSYLEDRNTTIKENEILWVLSLPPPWDSTSEKLLLDYLDQEKIENYCILSSETAILRYCEHGSCTVNKLNDRKPVRFSRGERILVVQSEVEFTDITSAIVLETLSVSPMKKKRDLTLSPKSLAEDYLSEMSEQLEINRVDLDNLIDEENFFDGLKHKCKLTESALQESRQRIKFQVYKKDKILSKYDFSKFVSDNGPLLSESEDWFVVSCKRLSSLLQDLSLRLFDEIKEFMLENTYSYIIVVGKIAFWPIVIENLHCSFPDTCILAPNDFHLPIITAGSIIHGHMKRMKDLE